MASEAQQNSEIFRESTRELFVEIDCNANLRGICLKDAIEAIGLSSETVKAMQNDEPISQDDRIEIVEWLDSEEVDPDMYKLHAEIDDAVVEMLGASSTIETR